LFDTPEEAALVVARARKADAELVEEVDLKAAAAEAVRAAAAEGLTLERSNRTTSGFEYVYKREGSTERFVAKVLLHYLPALCRSKRLLRSTALSSSEAALTLWLRWRSDPTG
jgi:hypothetical protein